MVVHIRGTTTDRPSASFRFPKAAHSDCALSADANLAIDSSEVLAARSSLTQEKIHIFQGS